ncbi:MAG: hypothetical protein GEU28_14035 [Dehalococcoidia bacterium]|nr:hypothetical protein [Dehalococcoidia bacterium]
MNSSLIGKIEKAHRYAAEPQRMRFESFKLRFDGENDTHEVSFADGRWNCSCNFFAGWGLCSHSMALERVLDRMLPPEAVQALGSATAGAH